MESDKNDVSSVSDRESDEYELTGGSNIEDDLETSGSEYDDGEIEYEVSSDDENYYQRGKVIVMKWRDKRDVCLISTVHNIETQEVATKSGPKVQPKAVIDYNHTMGGVSRVDQHLADYSLSRKRGKKSTPQDNVVFVAG
ncbi:hypothetical protein NQ314_010295 [Rhamnusium bicolor]|uniref:PiggyBac transposable element-derived protein domain-containing protein n=1 Tax=Rhamnusium bicolor TaxID=1586634 RepID=A0AAV8XTF8_9CUCU|nr:hypothetical protein NQ314_010295 [Rhamnusium bicolor]